MEKANPGKPDPNRKAGNEMKYTPAENVVGGPIENDPKPGLQADKGVVGTSKLPPVKK